jgi:hypothetical protein
MNNLESDGDDPLDPATYEIQPKTHRLDRYPIWGPTGVCWPQPVRGVTASSLTASVSPIGNTDNHTTDVVFP